MISAPAVARDADERIDDIPFAAIVEQSLAGVYVIQDERLVYVNETFASLIGYTKAELTGMHLSRVVPAPFLPQVIDNIRRRLSGEVPSLRYVSQGLHRDGHVVMIDVHGSRTMYGGRPAVCGVGVDITERLQREDALRDSQAQLQQLATHLSTIREVQRTRFARELHDVLGGMLTSIKMDVTRIRRRVRGAQLVEITEGLLQLAQEAIDTVRAMSEELRPAVLDHLGLVAALERELGRLARRSGLAASFEAPAGEPQLSPCRATGVYRIAQEALCNVARHAQAKSVRVALTQSAADLTMEVDDDGCGISATGARSGALGVIGMRERARELGGTLAIGPRPGGGTRLSLTVPLAP